MYPQALQMTRDECRGILRRLELESYSHVISVFRAQGGLSDNKAKLLEELRGIFHISQERHRAEARRVANDEQLSTIAEAISGPNTWQEWSREGRRSFPMLPRVAPQTALALIANNVAAETAAENAKLPFPAETGAALVEQHAATARNAAWEPTNSKREGYVVTDDPFKMPEIPAGPKKNLKRNLSDAQSNSGSNKKRLTNDTSSPTKQQQHQQPKQYTHITANSASSVPAAQANASTNIRKLYHNHSNNKIQQPRYAHQQQAQKQKLAAKKLSPVSGGGATGGRRQTPVKSGRKIQSKAQEQKQQQQQQNLTLQQVQPNQQEQQQSSPVLDSRYADMHNLDLLSEQPQLQPQHIMPQIAASKKDITKNLSKLQLPVSTGLPLGAGPGSPATGVQSLSSAPPAVLHGKIDGKQLISTPVQKFILEDRQPPPQAQTVQLQAAATSPQIMTLPQISAAATKLRAANTTILPPGTKLTPKKANAAAALVEPIGVPANASVVSQPQVYNIIEGSTSTGAGTISNSGAQAPLVPPTHTPPAIIQLQSGGESAVASSPLQPPTQGKVLTTKLLPVVLSGGAGAGGASNAAGIVTSSANLTKIETLNNGATLVTAGGVPSNTNPIGSAIIKNVSSTLLLSPNQSGGVGTSNSTIFSTLGSGTSVFRKPSIIKAGTVIGSGNTVGKISSNFNVNVPSGGPQIISSVKLSPATATSTTGAGSHSAQQQQFLQQQLKGVTTTGMRTSVKICQSPNGKVFIQPANVDAAAKMKLQSGLQHKLLPNSLVGTTGASVANTPPQRIAIQKVQIIQAPLHSPGHLTGAFQQQPPHQKKPGTTTLTLANKSNMNMIFMGGRTSAGTITLAKGSSVAGNVVGNLVAKAHASMPQQSTLQPTTTQQAAEAVKPTNVVVIGAGNSTMPATQTHSQTVTPIKSPTYADESGKIVTSATAAGSSTAVSGARLDANQMITEDTPVDILNMPIIVDSSGATVGNNVVDSVTVLSSALVESATQQAQSQQKQQHSTIILGATDWEMELDQATAVAAASKVRRHYTRQLSGSGAKQRKSLGEQQQHVQLSEKQAGDDSDTIIIDDSFDDVIVEEQEDVLEEVRDPTNQEGQHEARQVSYKVSSSDISEQLEDKPKVLSVTEIKPAAPLQVYRIATDDEEPIEVIDEEQKHTSKQQQLVKGSKNQINEDANISNVLMTTTAAEVVESGCSVEECEADPGFDETIVTEIDENTAIEYVDEEHDVPMLDTKKEADAKDVSGMVGTNDSVKSRKVKPNQVSITEIEGNVIENKDEKQGNNSADDTAAVSTTTAEETNTEFAGKDLMTVVHNIDEAPKVIEKVETSTIVIEETPAVTGIQRPEQ